MGLSSVRLSGWRWLTVSRVETLIKLGKELLARSLSYMEAVQTSGHALSAMGSEEMKAHRR
jgi:hypothetical protein